MEHRLAPSESRLDPTGRGAGGRVAAAEQAELLRSLVVGDVMRTSREQVQQTEHWTAPPPRYNEASLVKRLEVASLVPPGARLHPQRDAACRMGGGGQRRGTDRLSNAASRDGSPGES
jgi:hypothetical protein